MYFSSESELQRLQSFRKLVCKFCQTEFKDLGKFKNHIQSLYSLKLCDLCLQNSKLFVSEQELYDEDSFKQHKATLHKKCNVCNGFFYDGSQLVAHIKSSHHFCEYCPLEKRTAFVDYSQLEAHYRQNHYFCNIQFCRESKHIVFVTYDELRDHYKKNHPGLNVPPPSCGFKLKEEEDKNFPCVFDDNFAKNPRPQTAVNSVVNNSQLNFPALAPPTNEKRILDYSKVIKKSPWNQHPQHFAKSEKLIEKQKKPEKKVEKQDFYSFYSETPDKYNETRPKPEINDIDRNISRLNSGHMTVEDFVAWFRQERLVLDNQTITMIRSKMVSNSDREKIIFLLNPSNEKNKKADFEEVKKG